VFHISMWRDWISVWGGSAHEIPPMATGLVWPQFCCNSTKLTSISTNQIVFIAMKSVTSM